MNTCSSYPLQEVPIEDAVEITENEINQSPDHFNHLNTVTHTNWTFNFYSLSVVFEDGFIGFTIILFLSILLIFFSFKNNFNVIYWLSLVNLLILFISTLSLCLTEIIEEINQIKIGYYLFILNSLAIIYFSKKIENEKQTSNL